MLRNEGSGEFQAFWRKNQLEQLEHLWATSFFNNGRGCANTIKLKFIVDEISPVAGKREAGGSFNTQYFLSQEILKENERNCGQNIVKFKNLVIKHQTLVLICDNENIFLVLSFLVLWRIRRNEKRLKTNM